MKKVGIVGAGVIGHRFARNFAMMDEVSITAICDININRAEQLQQEFAPDAALYEDYEQLMRTADIDFIYLGIPPKYHKTSFLKALEYAIPVITEKPIASTTEAGRVMVEQAERSKVLSTINLPLRYTIGATRLQEILSSGVIGELLRVDLRFRFPRWPRSWQDVDWLKTQEQGGPLREVGTHFLFLLFELGLKPIWVEAFVKYREAAEERMITALLMTSQHIPVQLDLLTNTAEAEDNSLILRGTNHDVSFREWYKLVQDHGTEEEEVLEDTSSNSVKLMLTDFITALDDGSTGRLVTLREAYQVQQIIDAIFDSQGERILLK